MGVPRALLLLLALSGAYWIVAAVVDRGPEDRELENPYHVLRVLERDATLRSAYHGERALLRRREPVWLDFETEARTAATVRCDAPVRATWSQEGLTAEQGSVLVTCEEPDAVLRLELPGPVVSSACSLVLEGRVRLPEAGVEGGSLALSLVSVEAVEAARDDVHPTLHVSRDLDPVDLPAALEQQGLQSSEWFEFQIGIPGEVLPLEEGEVAVTLRIPSRALLIDELVLRAAPRLEGLLANGHPRNVGATEGTYDLKRMLRRGNEERLCLLLPPPSTLEIVVEPGREARLTFGVTSLCAPNPMVATELVVAVSRESRFEETLLRTPLDASATTRFVDHTVDLTRYSGEPIRLQFRVHSMDPASAPILALADPVLDARLEATPPHVFWLTYPPELLAAEPPVFARLRDEGLTLTGLKSVSDEPAPNQTCALASRPLPGTKGLRPLLVPPRAPTLPEVLTQHGYSTFAAVETVRAPGVLQGFPRRWSATGGGPLPAVWTAFDASRPTFTLLELPAIDGAAVLGELLTDLETRELLETSLLMVQPVSGPGPVFVRLPGAAQHGRVEATRFGTIDLAPTLLALLGLPPCEFFQGQRLEPIPPHEDDIARTGLEVQDPVPLGWSPPLPRRRETVLDERQVQQLSVHRGGAR